jgi:arylsulfatase A-like enzyme
MQSKNHTLLLILLSFLPFFSGRAQAQQPPNIVLIITDDQGYGDLGITGNPHVRTPVIDRLARESVRFNRFYVSPVCAPTRASLMTGRFSLRTGVRDTYNGGATMAASEVTIAELLKQANYTTGIFGKWHLGDNYPSRPNDQGFDESLIHLSGGMGQVGDVTTYFKGDSSYFNPVLWHNGKQEAYRGYCSDIFANNAVDFIEKNQKKPFFCYLAFNAPHTPLQVPDAYYQRYKDIDPAAGFENDGRPSVKMSERDKEDARKVYAMVENIDDNLGRLFKKLDELKLTENTLVIFMTDNGPQQVRYVAGMRGRKGSVYQGGVRVPFYVKYPARFAGNRDIDETTAHIDVLPTLAQICQVSLPKDRTIDGRSLLPLLQGQRVDWADRPLFFYWSRRYPELYNNMAYQKGPYKLVGHTDYNAEVSKFELFDLRKDPYEQKNLVHDKPAVAKELKTELDGLFRELIRSENLAKPPLAHLGTRHENPVILNRNDADGQIGIWAQEEIYGLWKVKAMEGTYTLRFRFVEHVPGNGQMVVETKPFISQLKIGASPTDLIEMKNVHLPAMEGELVPYYSVGAKKIFPFWVEVERTN